MKSNIYLTLLAKRSVLEIDKCTRNKCIITPLVIFSSFQLSPTALFLVP